MGRRVGGGRRVWGWEIKEKGGGGGRMWVTDSPLHNLYEMPKFTDSQKYLPLQLVHVKRWKRIREIFYRPQF